MKDQFREQFGNILIMTAAHGVKIMSCRRIVFLVGSLYASFGNARIGISQPQFRGHEDLRSMAGRFNSGSSPGPAAADDQDICFKLDMVDIDVGFIHAALPL